MNDVRERERAREGEREIVRFQLNMSRQIAYAVQWGNYVK